MFETLKYHNTKLILVMFLTDALFRVDDSSAKNSCYGLDHVHDFRNNVNQQGDYLVFPRNLPIANNIKHNYIHHLIVNSEIR